MTAMTNRIFKRLKNVGFFLLLAAICIMIHCAPEGLMRTWSTSEDYDRDFQNILVMGLINNLNLRSDVENEVVYAARKADRKAGNAMSIFPPELGKPFDDIEKAKERMRRNGYDAVLTITLIDVKSRVFIAPEAAYQPQVHFDRFRNYYYRTYDLVYRPGYFSEYSQYYLETNFYELGGGHLVWSGRSKVFEPQELESFLPVYSRALFKELKMQGVVSR